MHSRALSCVFIGYPKNIKGYRLYDLQSKTVFVSRDVVFIENEFPFDKTEGVNRSIILPTCDSHTVKDNLPQNTSLKANFSAKVGINSESLFSSSEEIPANSNKTVENPLEKNGSFHSSANDASFSSTSHQDTTTTAEIVSDIPLELSSQVDKNGDSPLLFSDDCLDDPSLHEHDDSALNSNPFFVIPPLFLNLLLSSSRLNLFLPPSSGFEFDSIFLQVLSTKLGLSLFQGESLCLEP
ncbi:hypothetical protein GQ457_18G006600 [Hibiscus cannabinus]